MNNEQKQQVIRIAEWLRTLTLMPADAPYFSNGRLAADCSDAEQVLKKFIQSMDEAASDLPVVGEVVEGRDGWPWRTITPSDRSADYPVGTKVYAEQDVVEAIAAWIVRVRDLEHDMARAVENIEDAVRHLERAQKALTF